MDCPLLGTILEIMKIQEERVMVRKSMKNAGKSGTGKIVIKSDARKDRKSTRGMNGSPKKGGHGGKFTWSGDCYSPAEIGNQIEAVDARDPNFEEPETVETA